MGSSYWCHLCTSLAWVVLEVICTPVDNMKAYAIHCAALKQQRKDRGAGVLAVVCGGEMLVLWVPSPMVADYRVAYP